MRPASAITVTSVAAIVCAAPAYAAAETPDAPEIIAAIAVDAGTADVGMSGGKSGGVAVAAVPEVGPETPSTGTNEELLERYEATKAELDRYRAAQTSTEKRLAIFGGISALAWFLIAAIKRLGNLTQRGKRWLPLVAAGLGVAVGLFSYLGAGQTLFGAACYGAAPWLAPFIQEVRKALWPSEPSGG